jgi:hypothetical protein
MSDLRISEKFEKTKIALFSLLKMIFGRNKNDHRTKQKDSLGFLSIISVLN